MEARACNNRRTERKPTRVEDPYGKRIEVKYPGNLSCERLPSQITITISFVWRETLRDKDEVDPDVLYCQELENDFSREQR